MLLCSILQLANMVKRPVISIVSQQLYNFENTVNVYAQRFPELVASQFGDLAFRFPDAIVLGVVNDITGRPHMAPPRDHVVSWVG